MYAERGRKKWAWGPPAKYLYGEFLRALGLEHREEELLRLAESKPGRPELRELAARIYELRVKGMTAPQIQKTLQAEGRVLSIGAIQSYLTTRRRKKLP